MKITVLNTKTRQPVINTRIQIQVKGKDSGYFTYTTDSQGYFELDNKYSGQQIATLKDGMATEWTTAKDGATIMCNATTTTSGSTTGSKGSSSSSTTEKNKSKQTTQSYK